MAENEHLSAREFVHELERAVRSWSGDRDGFDDDLTVVVLDVIATGAQAQREERLQLKVQECLISEAE